MKRSPLGFNISRFPRLVSFDAGVLAGLVSIAVYMALLNKHWVAAGFLTAGAIWLALVGLRVSRACTRGDR